MRGVILCEQSGVVSAEPRAMSDATPATQEIPMTDETETQGPEPVAWMYEHPTISPPSFRLPRHDNLDRTILLKRGWTETPLSPTSLVTDLLEALRGWDKLHSDMIAAGGAASELTDGDIERFAVVQVDLMEKTRAAIAKAEGRS